MSLDKRKDLGDDRGVEIVSLLLSAAASQAVQALIRGRGPGTEGIAGAAAGATEQLLTAMLAAQDETARTLSRMEAKIDRLATAPYRTAMESGYRNLQMAQPSHRSGADRKRHIDAALQQFIGAASQAKETGAPLDAVVHTELLIATCWLAEGSPTDFHATVETAAARIFDEVHMVMDHGPSTGAAYAHVDAQLGGFKRALKGFGVDVVTPNDLARSELQLGQQYSERCLALKALFNSVQALRRDYGASPAACPRLLGFSSGRQGSPAVNPDDTVVLGGHYPVLESPAHIAGSVVHVHEAAVRLREPASSALRNGPFVVDAVLEVGGPAEYWAGAGWPQGSYSPWRSSMTPGADLELLPAQAGLPQWDGDKINADNAAAITQVAVRLWAPEGSPEQLAVRVAEPRKWFFVCHGLS